MDSDVTPAIRKPAVLGRLGCLIRPLLRRRPLGRLPTIVDRIPGGVCHIRLHPGLSTLGVSKSMTHVSVSEAKGIIWGKKYESDINNLSIGKQR